MDTSKYFAIHSLLYLNDEGNKYEEWEISTDLTHAANGKSPSKDFFRDCFIVWVLCSECTLGNNGAHKGEPGNPAGISILKVIYYSIIDVEEEKNMILLPKYHLNQNKSWWLL